MRPYLMAVLLPTLSACVMPFDDARNTPLSTVSKNYLLLWSGIPEFIGLTASGIIIGEGIAVTNRHVVDATSVLSAVTDAGGLVPVTVVAVSDRMDLAVIAIPTGLGTPLEIAAAEAGTEAWLMGSPPLSALGIEPVARGTVIDTEADFCSKSRCTTFDTGIMVAAPGSTGYSGGPMVDAQGRLIGLTQGYVTHMLDSGGHLVEPAERIMFGYSIDDVLAEVRLMLNEQQVAAAPTWLVP